MSALSDNLVTFADPGVPGRDDRPRRRVRVGQRAYPGRRGGSGARAGRCRRRCRPDAARAGPVAARGRPLRRAGPARGPDRGGRHRGRRRAAPGGAGHPWARRRPDAVGQHVRVRAHGDVHRGRPPGWWCSGSGRRCASSGCSSPGDGAAGRHRRAGAVRADRAAGAGAELVLVHHPRLDDRLRVRHLPARRGAGGRLPDAQRVRAGQAELPVHPGQAAARRGRRWSG